jgi:hypothetical protein
MVFFLLSTHISHEINISEKRMNSPNSNNSYDGDDFSLVYIVVHQYFGSKLEM